MMGREIPDSVVTGDFPPMVGLREQGGFVKGKVLEIGSTNNKNPVLTLELIDAADISTSISKGNNEYEEVEVDVGDKVQVIGSTKQLREKLPQVKVGEIVTITFEGKFPLKGNRTLNKYKVEVDD